MHNVGDVLVAQRVRDFAAASFSPHQVDGAQDAQVLGNKRLGDPQGVNQLVDASGLVAQLPHDRQPMRVRERSQQLRGRLETLMLNMDFRRIDSGRWWAHRGRH
jgi:hypothetical protein